LSPRSEFSDPARQIGQWHVDSTRQVARGRGKFLGLTHIDKDNGLAGPRGGAPIRLPRSMPGHPRAAGGTNGTKMLSWRAALRQTNQAATSRRFPDCPPKYHSAGVSTISRLNRPSPVAGFILDNRFYQD